MMLRSPHRPRRSARLGRRRRVHLFRLLGLTRARTSRCARVRATPAAAATWAPTPSPRHSFISRRTALPLLSGHPIRIPAFTTPHLPPSRSSGGNTPHIHLWRPCATAPAVATTPLQKPSSRHPHTFRRVALHGDGLLLRGLHGPWYSWRRRVLVPSRPRHSMLRRWARRLLPSHPHSIRARTAPRARRAMTPAMAVAWPPGPWPRHSCVSRRATLPLRSGCSERAPAPPRPRLALPWHTSGITPPTPQLCPP